MKKSSSQKIFCGKKSKNKRIVAYLTFAFNKYDYKRVISLTRKSRYNSNSSDPNVAKFFELTNKKNAEWLALQFELSEINYDVKYFYYDKNESIDQLYKATIKTKNNLYHITNIVTNQPSCSCYQMLTMNLPCRHIFKCRRDLNLSIIEPDMIKNVSNSLIDKDYDIDATSDTETETVRAISNLNKHKRTNNLSVTEKYNIAWNPIKELATALSHLNDTEFDEQLSLILEIKTLFENKIKFRITELDDEDDKKDENNSDNESHSNTVTGLDSLQRRQSVSFAGGIQDHHFEISKVNLVKGNPIGAKKKN